MTKERNEHVAKHKETKKLSPVRFVDMHDLIGFNGK
jgi:hypothetical protein